MSKVKGKLIAGLFVLGAVELGLLIWAGGYIGVLTLMYLVLVTGFVGISVMSQQARALKAHYENLMAGGMTPEKMAAINGAGSEVTGSFLAMLGGVLLLVPGLLSDAIGLLLLIPPLRNAISGKAQNLLKSLAEKGALGDPSSFGAFAGMGGAGMGAPGQNPSASPFNIPNFGSAAFRPGFQTQSQPSSGASPKSKSPSKSGSATIIDTTVIDDA